MRGSFSFKGKDINAFGLIYAPLASDIYVYNNAQRNISSNVFESHAGGYYYGASVQPKVFALRCYFEDTNINKGLITRINSFFTIGSEGKLVFDSRPYIYYNAIVTSIDHTKYLNQNNGYVTITFTAFYPFGRTIYKTYDGDADIDPEENIFINTGILKNDRLYINYPAYETYEGNVRKSNDMSVSDYLNNASDSTGGNKKNELFVRTEDGKENVRGYIVDGAEISLDTDFPSMNNKIYSKFYISNGKILLYNGGTEECSVSVAVNSNKDIAVHNITNDTYCKFINMERYQEIYGNKVLVADATNGSVYVIVDPKNDVHEHAFLYHDYGFIKLVPSMPIKRDIALEPLDGNKLISIEPVFDDNDIGKYVFMNGFWNKILSVEDEYTIEVEQSVDQDNGTIVTDIVLMNEIEIDGDISDTAEDIVIDFIYQYTFA